MCLARARVRRSNSSPSVSSRSLKATSRSERTPQLARGVLAAAAPRSVLPIDQRVIGASVHDEKPKAMGGQIEGHLGDGAVPTVEQQRVAVLAAQGRGLVHAADWGLRVPQNETVPSTIGRAIGTPCDLTE